MKNITVKICLGTTCYVMGSSELQDLAEHLPDDTEVNVEGATCLGFCKDRKFGKAPYATVDGEIISEASLEKLTARIQELLASK